MMVPCRAPHAKSQPCASEWSEHEKHRHDWAQRRWNEGQPGEVSIHSGDAETNILPPVGRQATDIRTRRSFHRARHRPPRHRQTPWPKALAEQAQAVRAQLTALGTAATAIASAFKGALADRVSDLLKTLASLGRARTLPDGTFVAQ
jgi:hypothetical protein